MRESHASNQVDSGVSEGFSISSEVILQKLENILFVRHVCL